MPLRSNTRRRPPTRVESLVPFVALLLALAIPARAQVLGQAGASEDSTSGAGATTFVSTRSDEPVFYELYFDVDGNISSAADGRFILKGALWMLEERDGDAVRLTSRNPKNQYWRYTMEDPPNLFGDNSKRRFASVLILRDHRNSTWNDATRPMRALGERISERYYPGKTLHTNKHFYILGSSRDRFHFQVDRDGSVGEVTNLLTRNADGEDSYNSLGWDYWAGYEEEDGRAMTDDERAGRWGRAAGRSLYGPGSRSENGSWYPNVFEALAQSMTFFGYAPYDGGSPEATRNGARYTRRMRSFPSLFETLLVTFEDEAEQLDYSVDVPTMSYRARVRGDRLTVTGTTGRKDWSGSWSVISLSGNYTLTRTVEYDLREERLIRDELEFDVTDDDWKANMNCNMKVGLKRYVPPQS